MKNFLIAIVVLVVIGVLGFFALNSYIYNEKQAEGAADYKNATYIIESKPVTLSDGVAEEEAAPGSESKIVTKYFGNEVRHDLNADGKEDVVFLLTQSSGGSGTFYYVVAALNTDNGYVGSEGLLLGDRISPQTTEVSQNPSHKGVIIVNYADRLPGEPMTAQPSAAKSIWLKLDPNSMQFGEVVQNFEGEANPALMKLDMKTWKWVSALYNDGREVKPRDPNTFSITFGVDGGFSLTTDCNSVAGKYVAVGKQVTFKDIISTKKYCEGAQEGTFIQLLGDSTGYHFTSKGELILDLKFDSGSVTFR